MTEADAIASLQGIKHQLLAIFKTLGGPRVYLEDGAGPAGSRSHAGGAGIRPPRTAAGAAASRSR